MDAPQHERVAEILHAAAALSGPEREEYLERACNGDAAVRAEVESLLTVEDEARVLSFTNAAISFGDQAPLLVDYVDSEPPPAEVGEFRILRKLGEGGSAIVYCAEQASPRRTVALKIMRAGIDSKKALRRFECEAEILSRLRHPGIAQIYQAGHVQTTLGVRPYFAMEMVEGRALGDHARENQLSLEERLALFVRVCDTVHHAHQKAIIHRDLKPGNILVDGSGQPRVLDFGIARATDADQEHMTRELHTGQFLGTLPYMSPEQVAEAPADLDLRSDVYSLGVVLYELLTGHLPYADEGTPLVETLRAIQQDAPRPMRGFDRRIGRDLEAIVLRALEKDRERRYASASELGADVQRYLDHEPILARPPRLLDQLGKLAWHHKGLAAGILVAAASLAAGVVGVLRSWRTARAAELEAVEAATSIREEKDKVERLSDAEVAEELVAQVGRLWPRRPGKIAELDEWLERYETVRHDLWENELYLALLRGQGQQSEDGHWTFPDRSTKWKHDLCAALVDRLHRLGGTEEQSGLVAEIRQRRDFAARIRAWTVDEHADAWEEAITGIRESPVYGGLELEPQVSLVPLGPNESGLWEFWLWESGTEPVAGDGGWTVDVDSGLVLVLIPGGRFWMGAQSRDRDGENYSELAAPPEWPVHEVELDAFFLSKFEMTKAQWERLTGQDPSYFQDQKHVLSGDVTALHPVENVSWNTCGEWLFHWELDFPTEAQWEYAARGGTSTPWFSGDYEGSLEPFANLADASNAASGGEVPEGVDWDDGFTVHAPVGSFQPNPFGLHDVLGNVDEWCRDWFGWYHEPVRPGDGLRRSEEISIGRMFRGGNYDSTPAGAHCSFREPEPPENRLATLGIRPMRPVQR